LPATTLSLDSTADTPKSFPAGAIPLSEGNQDDRQETMMLDENLARLRAYRTNIQRYRRLLATQLSELERTYIERRLEEELASAAALSKTTFPFALPLERHGTEAAA
jgi:hypothetical protein